MIISSCLFSVRYIKPSTGCMKMVFPLFSARILFCE
nr:MAG TPA_asm: hypothetical protein [Caudoviricetes sp.]